MSNNYTCNDGDTPTIDAVFRDAEGLPAVLPAGTVISCILEQQRPTIGEATESVGELVDAATGKGRYKFAGSQTALIANQQEPSRFHFRLRATAPTGDERWTWPVGGAPAVLTVHPSEDTELGAFFNFGYPVAIDTRSYSLDRLQEIVGNEGHVQLAPGSYSLLATGLEVNGAARIDAAGADVTSLTYTGEGAAIRCNSDSSEATRATIRDLSMIGPGKGGSSVGLRVGRGSGSPSSAQVLAYDLRLQNFGIGLELSAAQICRFINVRADGNGVGMKTALGTGNTQLQFMGCTFNLNEEQGIYLTDINGADFLSCDTEDNGHEGILLENPDVGQTRIQMVRFAQHWFEDNNAGAGREGTGVADFRAQALGVDTCSLVYLEGSWWGTVHASDYHMHIGNGERVTHSRDRVVDPGGLKVFSPTTGTVPRRNTPGRTASRANGVQGDQRFGHIHTGPDGDTRWNCNEADILIVNNSVATSVDEITTYEFTDGETARVWVKDANTTLVHTASGDNKISLPGGSNIAVAANTMLEFVIVSDHWHLIGSEATG